MATGDRYAVVGDVARKVKRTLGTDNGVKAKGAQPFDKDKPVPMSKSPALRGMMKRNGK